MSFNFINLETKEKLSIPNIKIDDFFKSYSNKMFRDNCCIYEYPQDLSAFWLDFDLDQGSIHRKYTPGHIKQIIQIVNTQLKIYFDDKQLNCFVLEKPQPGIKGKRYKDGFHLLYPLIKMYKRTKQLVIDKIIKVLINDKSLYHLKGKHTWATILDKGAVNNMNMLLGSHKSKGSLFYNLTHVYDTKGNDVLDKYDCFENWELVKMMSLNYDNKISEDKKTLNKVDIPKNVDLMDMVEENRIKAAKTLLPMLSDSRSENYHDWLYVGFALKNTSQYLKEDWLEFSKMCPSKYNTHVCKKVWQNAKSDCEGLTLNDLSQWAEEDSPTEWGLLFEDV